MFIYNMEGSEGSCWLETRRLFSLMRISFKMCLQDNVLHICCVTAAVATSSVVAETNFAYSS